MEGEDDLYAFSSQVSDSPVLSRTSTAAGGGAAGGSNTSSRISTAFRGPNNNPASVAAGGGNSRPETSRPQTSINPAGWNSATQGSSGAGFGVGPGGADFGSFRAPVARPQAATPEEISRELEREINTYVEESAQSAVAGDPATALKKAKHAAKLHKKLEQHRQANGLMDANLDLAYAVHFNLGVQFEASRMFDQAVRAYKFVVSQKSFQQAGRLHVNIGNIFYEQEKFADAIKHFKMAVDKIPATSKETKLKVQRNIANAQMRLGKLQEAVQIYEAVMQSGSADPQSAINMTVCYFALGDKEKMKHAFVQMLVLRKAVAQAAADQSQQGSGGAGGQNGAPPESPRGQNAPVMDDLGAAGDVLNGTAEVDEDGNLIFAGAGREPLDELTAERRRRQRQIDNLIISAAQLIAPVVSADFNAGYDWLLETLAQNGCQDVANELEISKAMTFMRQREFDKAIETLKSFEKKDHNMASPASTNLSFLYYLEQDLVNAEKYADLALATDRYNSKALVNKGNCLVAKADLSGARDYYLEALGLDSDCVEAIYNLGLVSKRTGDVDTALKSFQKLHAILPSDRQVVFQIALLFEKKGDVKQAIRWYKTLNTLVPTDPGVLAKLGALHSKTDDSTAYQYYVESYRYFPANLHVVSWLGAYYVRSEAHEKAVPFFQRAWQLQPTEIQWQLMVAMCHRRTGSYQQALEMYQEINRKHPENTECLRHLVQLATDLGMKEELHTYAAALRTVEQQKLMREEENKAASDSAAAAQQQADAESVKKQRAQEEDWQEVDVNKMLPL